MAPSGALSKIRVVAAIIAATAWAQAGTATIAAAQSPDDHRVNARVEGTILGDFKGVRRPLNGAVVETIGPTGQRRGSVTDSAGHFSVDGLSAGSIRLAVTAVGHEAITVRISVPPGGTIKVDLEMKAAPLEVAGVAVVADAVRSLQGENAGEIDPAARRIDTEVAVSLLEISPGVADAGLVRTVQALPGNDPADPSDVLFMRGSTTEMKLVLLDGVPVYTPFHVAGLMRSFEPTVLESARLHLGGAPARYDGGLTHILDLRTRTARRDRVRATGSIDLLSASAAMEAPLGRRVGLVTSARSLHDLGQGALGGERPYGYRDLLISVDGEPVQGHGLRATGFWNDESVRLDFDPVGSDASWSNRVVSLGYEAPVAGARLRLDAGVSRYRASLPFQPSSSSGEEAPEALIATSANDRARMTGELTWGTAQPVRVGVALEEQRAMYRAATLSRNRETTSEGSSTLLGVYGEGTRSLSPEVSARLGLRADFFGSSSPRLAPRVALHWSLTPDALISIAAGRYHQAGGQPDPRLEGGLELVDGPGAREATLPVATADHVVLTLAQRLGESVSMELDGFWKRFLGVGEGDGSILNSGVDLRVLRAGEESSVWLGYGLSWFWSPMDQEGGESEFAGRHLLSTGISGALFGPFKGEARLAYGAGLPSTSIPFGSAATDQLAESPGPEVAPTSSGSRSSPATPLDDFLRLDLELYAVFQPDWGGGSWRVRPYLRLLNALDRRDALFYTYQPWRSDAVTPLAERPILPVFGVAFSF